MTALPQEILNEIVGQLVEDEVTLKTCSTVSSAFREPSQKQLFHSIVLDLGRTKANRRLYVALSSNPFLALFVRSLTVGLCEDPDVGIVCAVLQEIQPHVREVRLENFSSFSLGTWKSTSEYIKSCLIGLLYAPCCIALTLGDVSFPAKYLPRISHLRHLNLRYIASITADDAIPPLTDREPLGSEGYLATLTLGSHTIGERLRKTLHDPIHPSSLSLSQLRKIEAADQASTDIQTLLNISASYLQEVRVAINLYLSGEYLDFRSLLNLRVLRIHVRSGLRGRPGDWILRVLATLPSIEELEVTMRLALGFGLTADEWQELDVLLTQKCLGGTLRRVVLGFDGQLEETNRWFLMERTPRLKRAGVLLIHSGV